MADRERFDRDFLEQPFLAEPARHRAHVDFVEARAGVRTENAVFAFVDFAGADKAAAGQTRSGNAADAGPGRVQAFVPGTVGAVFGNCRGGAAGESLRILQALRAQVE